MAKILVTEDEPYISKMLEFRLNSLGHEILLASDGEQALNLVDSDRPDLLILDVMMPVMGGLTFLKKLRKDPLHMGLPVFVLTDKAITEDESERLEELASAVLFKDDAPEQLGELLGSIFSLADAQG